ncbi:MAG: colicin E3-like toxin immunity protein [Enterobacter hormaechei]|nr:colicin E3-like toxin immunity protein [Enterobacter hormaechei]
MPLLQPHFQNRIDTTKFNYFVAFDYRDKW